MDYRKEDERERQARTPLGSETDRDANRTQTPASPNRQHDDDSLSEEAAAVGQRTKGVAKDAWGAVTGNERLEREGERDRAEGRQRQAANDAFGDTASGRTMSSGYVTGLYDSPESADRAYERLTTDHGYRPEDINVLMTDETRKRYYADPSKVPGGGTKAAEGLGKGAAIGGGIGAALAAIFAIGSNVVVPGLGLVVAGPIAAALAGAGAGGATGGLIGALVGAGIPEDRARAYERGLQRGGVVIGTRARDDAHAAQLERELGDYGGTEVMR